MKIPLTKRQLEIFNFIKMFIAQYRIPPTRKEIADQFGFYLNAAQSHVLALEKKGWIYVHRTGRGGQMGKVVRGISIQ